MIWRTEATDGGPAVLAIDLNANPTDIPHISERLMAKYHWIDAAGRASLWGGIDEQPTCNAPGAKATTRRDYIFVHPALARYISKVTTYNDGMFATHARVEVTFRFNDNTFLTRATTKTTTIHYQGKEQYEDPKERRAKYHNAIEGHLKKRSPNSKAPSQRRYQ